jgi:hypothetical protein
VWKTASVFKRKVLQAELTPEDIAGEVETPEGIPKRRTQWQNRKQALKVLSVGKANDVMHA